MASRPGDGGAVPAVDAASLVGSVPGLASAAVVETSPLLALPSASLDISTVLGLAPALHAAASGACGVVVTTGTDTLEEVAFLLDLVWTRSEPVVLTGAMRTADSAGADGPANLLAAVTVAASVAARDQGCLVVMNDEVHAANTVRKLHTTSPAAFASPETGPAGRVQEGKVALRAREPRPAALVPQGEVPRVALVRVTLGDDATLLRHAVERCDGVVVEGLGGGHVPSWWVEPLLAAAQHMPIVLASRTGAGGLLERTYGFAGSERQLLGGGLVSAGHLDGLKARLLLTVAMMSAREPSALRAVFHGRCSGGYTPPRDDD